MRRALFYSCLLLLSWSVQLMAAGPFDGPGYGQPPGQSDPVFEYSHTLNWIRIYSEKLEKSHATRLPQLREPLEQLQKDARFLTDRWLEWARKHEGKKLYQADIKLDLYFRSLENAQFTLEKLRKKKDDEILTTVNTLAKDLHFKAESCRASDDGLGKEITVTVRTMRGTNEVAGYEVYCAPMALVKFDKEHIRFPKISSPTQFGTLPPGFYAVWLKKGNLRTEPVGQIIGGDGKKIFPLDIPIPPDTP